MIYDDMLPIKTSVLEQIVFRNPDFIELVFEVSICETFKSYLGRTSYRK